MNKPIIIATILGDTTVEEVRDVLWAALGDKTVSINIDSYKLATIKEDSVITATSPDIKPKKGVA